jgi:hypothetical protein
MREANMDNATLALDYANNLMYELEKAFWDERGRGARFRMMNVGREYYTEKCRPLLPAGDEAALVQSVADLLQRDGLATAVSYSREDRLLRVTVKGCVHRAVEAKMMSRGIEPFTCVPANLIVLAIEEKLDRPVELAEIKVDDGTCQLLLVVFDHRPSLD